MNATKILITVGSVVALGGIALGFLALDDEAGPSIDAANLESFTETPSPHPSSTPRPPLAVAQPSPTPTRTPPTATPLPDRMSCDEIRGTAYRSASERNFFLASCVVEPTPPIFSPTSSPGASADSIEDCEEDEPAIELALTRIDKTYDVSGLTADEVGESQMANAPRVEGSPAYGLVEFDWDFDWTHCNSNGACGFATMQMDALAIVTLPNLTTYDDMSHSEQQSWNRYLERLSRHENRHFEIYEQGLEDMRLDFMSLEPQPTCEDMDIEIVTAWESGSGRITIEQQLFHISEPD